MITIHPLQLRDISQTIGVIQQSYKISLGKIYSQKLIKSMCDKYTPESMALRMKSIDYFIAKPENDQVAGVIGLKADTVRTFFVDPNKQGIGIGRMLYEHLENVARDRGIKKLAVEASPLGEAGYAHFGFTKIRTVQKEREGISFTDVYMEKELT